MKKLLLLLLVLLLGLLGIVWYQQQEPRTALPIGAIPIIHKSNNPAFDHKRVKSVHTAILHRRPQQLL